MCAWLARIVRGYKSKKNTKSCPEHKSQQQVSTIKITMVRAIFLLGMAGAAFAQCKLKSSASHANRSTIPNKYHQIPAQNSTPLKQPFLAQAWSSSPRSAIKSPPPFRLPRSFPPSLPALSPARPRSLVRLHGLLKLRRRNRNRYLCHALHPLQCLRARL